MFLLHKKNSFRMSSLEKEFFLEWLAIFRNHKEYQFLNSFFIEDILFFWNTDMNCENGVLGCFDWKHPNCIYISNEQRLCRELLISTVMHELYHMYQYKRFGIFYLLLLMPFIRDYTIEKYPKYLETLTDNKLKEFRKTSI